MIDAPSLGTVPDRPSALESPAMMRESSSNRFKGRSERAQASNPPRHDRTTVSSRDTPLQATLLASLSHAPARGAAVVLAVASDTHALFLHACPVGGVMFTVDSR